MPRNYMETCTEMQNKFCANWVANGGNAKQAARDAGYAEGSAEKAFLWLKDGKKPHITARIRELQKVLISRSAMKAEEILRFLRSVIETSITDYIVIQKAKDTEGNEYEYADISLKTLKALPKPLALLLTEITPTKDGLRIKIMDKMDAIREINKMLGFYELEHGGNEKEVNQYSEMTLQELQAEESKINNANLN